MLYSLQYVEHIDTIQTQKQQPLPKARKKRTCTTITITGYWLDRIFDHKHYATRRKPSELSKPIAGSKHQQCTVTVHRLHFTTLLYTAIYPFFGKSILRTCLKFYVRFIIFQQKSLATFFVLYFYDEFYYDNAIQYTLPSVTCVLIFMIKFISIFTAVFYNLFSGSNIFSLTPLNIYYLMHEAKFQYYLPI